MDSQAGGIISGNFVERTGQAGLYLAASTNSGASGCHNFTVIGNTVINAGNNSALCIGGRDNTITENILKGGWNAPVQLWSTSNCTVSDNKIEKGNFSTWNGQGVLGDAFCGGVVADGSISIPNTATFQARITGNIITEPSEGRGGPGIHAIRIMNGAFANGNKVFCQGNHSEGADNHFVKDVAGVVVADMDSRSQPQASGIRKNTNMRVVPVTQAGDTPLLNTDWLVVISHDAVAGVTCTLPTNAAHGQILVVKNGSNSSSGTSSADIVVQVDPTSGQLIDGRWSGVTLRGSDSQSGGVENESNQAARLIYDNVSNLPSAGIWWSVSDAY